MKKLDLWIFFLLLVILFVTAGVDYTKLPDRVALHFNGAGEPDGWGSKGSMITCQLVLYIFMGLLFGGIRFLVPIIPDSLVNMPNKEYWLAPERRDNTHRIIQQSVMWLGNATLLLFVVLFQFNTQANMTAKPALNMILFLPIFVGYMVFILGWAVVFTLQFNKNKMKGDI